MIPSFSIYFNVLYPDARAESHLPKDISYRITYAKKQTWYDQKNWYNIQWYNAKHVYLYSIEIETKRRLSIPVEISHPDIHWQYAIKGSYSLANDWSYTPVLREGQKHLIYGEKSNFKIEVSQGRHWIIGFNIATSWLDRYPEDLLLKRHCLQNELKKGELYQSAPIGITDHDRAELYYLLGLRPSRHILQDSQIYVPISNLVDQMQSTDGLESPLIYTKLYAIQHYIQRCISNDQYLPTINIIADQFCIDKDYLSRIHKKHQGQSLSNYIHYLKQERAADLLRKGIPIHDIAHLLGYSDSSSFRKAFKKQYGICPSNYTSSKF